jgi:hypothetical protein
MQSISLGFAETYNASSWVLTVTDGNKSARLTFDNFNGIFDFASDGHGGTLITDLPAGAVPGDAAAVTNTDQFIFRDFATRAREKTVDNFKFGGSRLGLDFHVFDPNDESTFNARLFGPLQCSEKICGSMLISTTSIHMVT